MPQSNPAVTNLTWGMVHFRTFMLLNPTIKEERAMGFAIWKEKHHDLWQFVMFNILCNISTISRFVLVWIGTAVFVSGMGLTQPFKLLIFDYSSTTSNGIGGFFTFLIAESLAQVVNFLVQIKFVFKTDNSFREAAIRYAVLAVVIVVMNLMLPGYVTSFCQGTLELDAELASTASSIVNTLAAVIISYPTLKFWVMPDAKETSENDAAAKRAAV